MAQHNELGKWGEERARDYFVAQGFAIMEQNLTVGKKEIDIIAISATDVAFVEVKTRATALTDPVAAVTPAKQRRMARAAHAFLVSHKLLQRPRFDVVAIVGTPERGYTLEHIPDAFLPPLLTGC